MSKNKNHNTVYFLTTLSVYLGLVFVGASPQVLAQAQTSKNSQSTTFEFSSRADNILTKLGVKKGFDNESIFPTFSF